MILGELFHTLESLIFFEGVEFWVWNNDYFSVYSIKSTYRFLYKRASEVDMRSDEIMHLLSRVCESWSHLKVKVFSWQLLQDRIFDSIESFFKENYSWLWGTSCVLCNEPVKLGVRVCLSSDLTSLLSIMLDLGGGRY